MILLLPRSTPSTRPLSSSTMATASQQLDRASRVAALVMLARIVARISRPDRREGSDDDHTRVTANHLSRPAIVYLRQSSATQVGRSRVDRSTIYARTSRELGWPTIASSSSMGTRPLRSGFVARSGARPAARRSRARPRRPRAGLRSRAWRATTPIGIAS